jgi:hypothetical protein
MKAETALLKIKEQATNNKELADGKRVATRYPNRYLLGKSDAYKQIIALCEKMLAELQTN